MHRKPTMADVARLAGVGTMTVSRVLSGTVPVAEETARRVQKAVEQLAYRPNQLARAFRGQRSRSIGLIIPYLYDSSLLTVLMRSLRSRRNMAIRSSRPLPTRIRRSNLQKSSKCYSAMWRD